MATGSPTTVRRTTSRTRTTCTKTIMLIINIITDTAGTILLTIAEAIVMGTTIVVAMTVEAMEAIATIEAIVRMKRRGR